MDRETVSLDLSRSHWEDVVTKRGRNMVDRARRAGQTVQLVPPNEGMGAFAAMYLNAMARMGADDHYLFTEDYFEALSHLVEKSGWLLSASEDGRWAAAAVFLRGPAFLHYHLAARDPGARSTGASNLIIATASELGAQLGLERLHLGGGLTRRREDPLLRFKVSMASDSHQYFTGRRIHDSDSYDELRDAWLRRYPHLAERYGDRILCYRYRQEAT
jgi:hypothetical protein